MKAKAAWVYFDFDSDNNNNNLAEKSQSRWIIHGYHLYMRQLQIIYYYPDWGCPVEIFLMRVEKFAGIAGD